MTACGIADAVNRGELTAQEVTAAALERIARHDTVRAFTRLWPERAAWQAADVQRRVEAGERLPLAGVPLGVKDTEGYDAYQTRRLLAAGCVAVGATATPGPGTRWRTWGATDRGPTLNPHDPRWTPGGSSAGSAAAVATGLVPLATGNDGAGSVRIPAAWCSVIGLKPTNGLVPARDRAGLNVAGPLARTPADAAAYLAALTRAPVAGTPIGETSMTGTSISGTAVAGGPFTTAPPSSPTPTPTQPVRPPHPGRPLRVTWSATLGFADTLPRIAATARSRLDVLLGTTAATWYDIAVRLPDPAPCWSALRGGDPATMRTAKDQAAAMERELACVFTAVDVIATPTTPNPPHGHEGPGDTMSVALTWAFNITGHPAISLPAGLTSYGEPVGLQLIARHHHEADLLALADALTTAEPV